MLPGPRRAGSRGSGFGVVNVLLRAFWGLGSYAKFAEGTRMHCGYDGLGFRV